MIRPWTIACMVWIAMLRKKDIYVLLILLAALLIALVSLDVFGLGGMTEYVKDIGLLCAWVLGWVLAVHLSVRELPQEELRGTIFPLLAKPVSRSEIILGKWMGVWGAVIGATAAFYAVLLLVVGAQGSSFNGAVLIQAFLLHIVALGVVTAIGLVLSTRLTADGAAALTYVFTASSFLIAPKVPALLYGGGAAGSSGLLALYFILPHFELFDLRRRLVNDWGPARWSTMAEVLAYGVALIALFLALAWLSYRHKRFVRGQLL